MRIPSSWPHPSYDSTRLGCSQTHSVIKLQRPRLYHYLQEQLIPATKRSKAAITSFFANRSLLSPFLGLASNPTIRMTEQGSSRGRLDFQLPRRAVHASSAKSALAGDVGSASSTKNVVVLGGSYGGECAMRKKVV